MQLQTLWSFILVKSYEIFHKMEELESENKCDK